MIRAAWKSTAWMRLGWNSFRTSVQILLWLTATAVAAETTAIAASTPSLAAVSSGRGGLMLEQSAVAKEADSDSAASNNRPNGLQPFETTVRNLEKIEGLFTLYRNAEKGTLYLALSPQQLNHNYLLVATLDSGIGEAGLFSSWPLNDALIQFRRAPNNKLHLVVPNINFRHPPDQPGGQALLERSYSDSILAALNIISIEPETNVMLVDLGSLLLNNDPANILAALSWGLGGYSLNTSTSYVDQVQNFPSNLEIESVLGFSGGGDSFLFSGFASIPDARGFSLRVRYSWSDLPTNNGYQPRLADERVGYFVTAYQTPLDNRRQDPFVRYIQRWHLEKQDPTAQLSPPREPIVFWIENTVPEDYRAAIREGILMWNAAFEKIGFQNAIEVRQMPVDADWDPADIRYNTIRWSDSFQPWAEALGPVRVNPLTGEILDADIIIDANVIRHLTGSYRTLASNLDASEQFYGQLCGHRYQSYLAQWMLSQANHSLPQLLENPRQLAVVPEALQRQLRQRCVGLATAQQTAFGALALATLQLGSTDRLDLDTYIYQYLRALTAHEVGHTLGLRHNFRGSLMLSPAELHDPSITRSRGLVSSLMDYFPINLAPPGMPQGDYFPMRLGPYDEWAIEYGYKPIEAIHPQLEQQALRAIASRINQPELTYGTDEDAFTLLDPETNAFDLSNDPLQYAQWQMQNAQAVWQRLENGYLLPDESYSVLRDRFETVFNYYFNQALTVSNYVGGQRFNRQYPGDVDGRLPFEPIALEKQQAALETLQTYVFAADAFNFSPQLLNQLAPDRWYHWGSYGLVAPLDYPIYDRISLLQGIVLVDLLSANRLSRIQELELKANSAEVLTVSDLFASLQQGIWRELEADSVEIGLLRRGLQRHYLNILSGMVLRSYSQPTTFLELITVVETMSAPEDARVIARYQLRQLARQIDQVLRKQGRDLDVTTLAHLEDSRERIQQILNAQRVAQ
ncbi:zinc-dependent metalloprotease [Almyronema epifaneia]|uniref:Zinc-dependent metalloprotease n=1 Tax=Almyronema epifaneia S1 TaxID=2991925 RepID=A0ABW6IEJ8_9CYAN